MGWKVGLVWLGDKVCIEEVLVNVYFIVIVLEFFEVVSWLLNWDW
jgi:hypothetical protein